MDKLYIPRDLVMTNGVPLGTAQDVVYRVTSSDPSKTLELDDGTVLKGVVRLENYEAKELGDKGYLLAENGAWAKYIVPIPLTPEILKKNGWKPTKESLGHSFKYKKYPRFALWSINDKWNFTIDGVMVCNTLSCLCYVHELQHLLFGLGLNSDMEV